MSRERERENRNGGREGKKARGGKRGGGSRRKAVAGRENRGDVHAFNR